jgi:sigma-B regulation protein RsbU (phosphoserine phosphatase)
MLDDAAARYTSPAATLHCLNERLAARLPEGLFVTLFHGLLDLERGELLYAGGGHEFPLLVRASGALEELPATGMALGILPDTEFEERALALSPGDLLLCFTDGIIDQRLPSGERFGRERFQAAAREYSALTCPDLVRALLERGTAGVSECQDDITLVAVRYLGHAEG